MAYCRTAGTRKKPLKGLPDNPDPEAAERIIST